jgi:CYTH domain-containing protein
VAPTLTMKDKYARDEFERRFIASSDAPTNSEPELITDRYIDGTRLRLRFVRSGTNEVFKLAKIIDIAIGHKKLTNLYLSEDEAQLLAALPAKKLRKRRFPIEYEGQRWCIDEFEGGLLIAEVEHALGETVHVPPWCIEEVTHRPEYSCWSLAR